MLNLFTFVQTITTVTTIEMLLNNSEDDSITFSEYFAEWAILESSGSPDTIRQIVKSPSEFWCISTSLLGLRKQLSKDIHIAQVVFLQVVAYNECWMNEPATTDE